MASSEGESANSRFILAKLDLDCMLLLAWAWIGLGRDRSWVKSKSRVLIDLIWFLVFCNYKLLKHIADAMLLPVSWIKCDFLFIWMIYGGFSLFGVGRPCRSSCIWTSLSKSGCFSLDLRRFSLSNSYLGSRLLKFDLSSSMTAFDCFWNRGDLFGLSMKL